MFSKPRNEKKTRAVADTRPAFVAAQIAAPNRSELAPSTTNSASPPASRSVNAVLTQPDSFTPMTFTAVAAASSPHAAIAEGMSMKVRR